MTQMSFKFRSHVERSETSLDLGFRLVTRTCSEILRSAQNDNPASMICEISVIRGS
jgi:hypothetical protein